MEERIKTALEFLKSGQSFRVGYLLLGISGLEIIVTGWSKILNFSNISKDSSLDELREIKLTFASMLSISPDLRIFVSNMRVKYLLCYDDGGKLSIDICYEEDGVVKWISEFS